MFIFGKCRSRQLVWIPFSPLLYRLIISDFDTSPSPTSRNCFSHLFLGIYYAILATSSRLLIIASIIVSLACRRKSSLPPAHWGHAKTMSLTFCDGYPHRQLSFSTPGCFLLYRQEVSPIYSLLSWMAHCPLKCIYFWLYTDQSTWTSGALKIWSMITRLSILNYCSSFVQSSFIFSLTPKVDSILVVLVRNVDIFCRILVAARS